jgi:hypothetical protein
MNKTMNANGHDPIRVLLIDDYPQELYTSTPPPEHPEVRYVFSDVSTDDEKCYFDLKWLATPGECREFMDLTRLIDRQSESAHDKSVWVPDILIIDYSLAKRFEPVAERLKDNQPLLEQLSPLVSLRAKAESLGLPQFNREEYTHQIREHENCGCYAGGLLLVCHADHPTAPVTITIRTAEELQGTNTGYFQWLLAGVSAGQLQAAGKFGKNWKNLIECGVKRLRDRIEQLEKVNLVILSVKDLFEMTKPDSHENKNLKMWSRFGLRHLPLKALFLDIPEADRQSEIQKWARARLEARMKRSGFGGNVDSAMIEVGLGIDLAEQLWKAYDTDIRLRRERLHELASQAKAETLAKEDRDEYEKEKKFFDAETGECLKNVSSIEKAIKDGFPHRAIRWAALFVILRLYGRKTDATRTYQQHFASKGFSDAPTPFFTIKHEDVYLALYPSPSIYKDASSNWSKHLIRLESRERPKMPKSDSNKDAKNLGLNIEHVLEGKVWVADENTPAENWTFGLIRDEEHILKVYALLETGLKKSDGSGFLKRVFPEHNEG